MEISANLALETRQFRSKIVLIELIWFKNLEIRANFAKKLVNFNRFAYSSEALRLNRFLLRYYNQIQET